ncbi:MAG: hypothetical protein FWC94_01630 [Bacteroidales bacterium]|nr:hypothetical protein [Bacteroidales bacterium]
MKKFITILGIAAIAMMFTSCNQRRIAELEEKNQVLEQQRQEDARLQESLIQFLQEIENNLAEIRSREQMIQDVARERPRDMQQRITQDLADISALMDQNRERLNDLERVRRQLNTANANNRRLQELIDTLTRRVEEQEAQIQQLREELEAANQQIAALTTENQRITQENEQRQAQIDEQTVELNTAFFTMGTAQALRAAEVTTRRGGFIGIGRAQIIYEDAVLQNFTRIDIREFTRLETNSQRIDLITPHPTGSFRINDENPRNLVIEITNPTDFWQSSKFLVVRTR